MGPLLYVIMYLCWCMGTPETAAGMAAVSAHSQRSHFGTQVCSASPTASDWTGMQCAQSRGLCVLPPAQSSPWPRAMQTGGLCSTRATAKRQPSSLQVPGRKSIGPQWQPTDKCVCLPARFVYFRLALSSATATAVGAAVSSLSMTAAPSAVAVACPMSDDEGGWLVAGLRVSCSLTAAPRHIPLHSPPYSFPECQRHVLQYFYTVTKRGSFFVGYVGHAARPARASVAYRCVRKQ